MVGERSPRRRDVLRTGAAAGILGFAGLTLNSASAQETTTAEADGQGRTGIFSYSLEEGDRFRVRFRPRDPFGEPATETVPAACLGGDADEEYQVLIVRGFRDGENLGFRGVLAPQRAIETETPETTTEADGMGGTTTEATMQDETTTGGGTMGGELPELEVGEWYAVTSSEACDGLNRLTVEITEAPETTAATATTEAEMGETEMGEETTTE